MENTKKILIIDDEAYIRRVIELKLKSKGYQVFAANNGEEGLIIFNRYQPDVVITDIRMPKMNGKVFCEQTDSLKAERPFLTIIITFFLTVVSLIDKIAINSPLFLKPIHLKTDSFHIVSAIF